jgi:hypothetical protein
MAPEDMKKTALITKTRLYDWTVMPFGLKNATNNFSKTMSEVFEDLGDKFLKVFVDDLNIYSESWEEHLQHLEVNLKLNLNKSCFVAKKLPF